MRQFKQRVRIDMENSSLGLKIAARLQEMGVYSNANKDVSQCNDMDLFKEGYIINVTDNLNTEHYFGVENVIIVKDGFQQDVFSYSNDELFISESVGVNSICSIIKFHCEYGTSRKRAMQAATMILTEAGIQPNLKGYTYLKEIISAVAVRPELCEGGTTGLYKYAAELYNVNSSSVEKAMRDAISTACANSNQKFMQLFKFPVGKPFSSELIAVVADDIRTWIL